MSKKDNKKVKRYSLKEIKEAGKRIDRSCKGEKEEYINHLLKIYKETKPLRRRATKCVLKEKKE